MLSPFAPHMAEELWELLGHRGGVTAAGWPQYQEDVARASEITVPVQVNGKVRARLTVPADISEERPAGGGAEGSAGRPLPRGQDRSQGRHRRRRSPPGQHRRVLMMDRRHFLLGGLAALALPGCGYSLSGRGSFLPASIKTIGVPLFTNTTSLFEIEQRVTDKVRAELIGRGRWTVSPTPEGVDALLTGEITARHSRAGSLQRAAAGDASGADARRARRAARRQGEQGDLGQSEHAVQRDLRGQHCGQRTGRQRLPSATTPTRSNASPPNSRARSSARCSKPSDAGARR